MQLLILIYSKGLKVFLKEKNIYKVLIFYKNFHITI